MNILRERYFDIGRHEYILKCYYEYDKANALQVVIKESAMTVEFEEQTYQMLEQKLKDLRK